jgi:hypothetical protein
MVWNMKGNIEQLFRERFQGHETPVDPGMWEAIQQQMGATAPAAADGVNELFRERFAEHEVQMDASVWEGISKELGHAAPAVPGQSVLGWAAATAGVLVVAAGLWYLGTTDGAPEAPSARVIIAEQTQTPESEQPVAEPAPMVAEATTTKTAVQGSDEERPTSPTRATSSTIVPVPASAREADGAGDATPIDPLPNAANTPTTPPLAPTPAEPALVETIIQQITERTVNEVRANPDGAPAPMPEPASEPMGATRPADGEQEAVPEIFMANTFTPNGDQINDTYEVSPDGFEQLQMRVMSMKNDRLVFSTNTGEPWTGEGCEDGMYVVVVEAVTTDGRPVSKAKVVWLNRERMN